MSHTQYLDFYHACETYEKEHPELTFVPMVEYVNEHEFLELLRAIAWWPQYKPKPVVGEPLTIQEFVALRGYYPHAQTKPSFRAHLDKRGRDYVDWMRANGRSIPPADETPEQKKARLNRDAQKRHLQRAAYRATENRVATMSPARALHEVTRLQKEFDKIKADYDMRIQAAKDTLEQVRIAHGRTK